MSVRGPADPRRTGARRPRRRAGAALAPRRARGSCAAARRSTRWSPRAPSSTASRPASATCPSVRIDAGRRRAAPAQPRALARRSASASRCRPRSCAGCCCCSPTVSRKGHSGVRAELVELLLGLLDRDVLPVVPSRGLGRRVGRPRAARARRGRALRRGRGDLRRRAAGRRRGAAARRARPIELAAKEGLALINGTHLMAAVGALALRDARALLDAAIVAGGALARGVHGLDAAVRRAHPRPPPRIRARRASRRACARSSTAAPIVASHADCGRVQDPYTLRCVPQVLGAIADALDYVAGVLERELDAVTDNPLRLPRRRRGRLGRQLPRPAAVARRSTTSGLRCASWRRSRSGAPTRCSRRATPGCRASSRPTRASRRA